MRVEDGTNSNPGRRSPAAGGRSPWPRRLLILGYGGLIAIALAGWSWAPRVFWTVVMPMVPIGFVLAGFHAWRRACPIAAAGELGARRRAEGAPRLGRWLRDHGSVIALSILVAVLVLRLVLINGDAAALGVFLLALPLLAYVVNRRWGGRTFCQSFCPVGVVERIYTDAARAVVAPHAPDASGCATCTGCVASCPDLDARRSFERTRTRLSKRVATYAFPGVVFAFYAHYALRGGSWAHYFDGAWTRDPFAWDHVLGAGYAAAPQVPGVLAAALTLVSFGLISALVFFGIERLLARRTGAERATHVTLVIAGFVAFNVFYLFAGAPTLRLVPGATDAVSLVVAAASLSVLLQRWRLPDRRRRTKPQRAQRQQRAAQPRRRLPVLAEVSR